ncbi:hypothetical protein [Nocardioides sp. GY 10127]|uniref:hypothetical protein n=1 Tax=Nocardioides sp. GY 10127 TaxID=2569762 RepID=UPI0010A87824|nr:hypothetical protein [Nocardioides sp. GY 10127]TIC81733.1 hypothetical protein E8D37_11120 [Nocardioides sp. GY 10127]
MPTPQERDEMLAEQRTDAEADGQVSEVGALDPADADTPISDDQSVAGQPDGESGTVDEGPTGPNSRAGSDRN